MRIEDTDGPRVKPDAAESLLSDLAWIGIDWDGPPTTQSADLTPYLAAMHTLAAKGLIYPCDLTRSEIEAAASAPQAGAPHESRFPPELRPAERPTTFDDPSRSWRLAVEPGPIVFHDDFAGPQSHDPGAEVGDFVVWTKRGMPAYQLAVVVDDFGPTGQHITHIVRGDDLLPSTARQITLARALSYPIDRANWLHLPLVVGEDGRRLAKRHGDTRISHYRELGTPPERLIGLIAHWCGNPSRATMSIQQFQDALDLSALPKAPTKMTPEDHQWLNAQP